MKKKKKNEEKEEEEEEQKNLWQSLADQLSGQHKWIT